VVVAKFQKVRATDTTLDRVQDNVGAALTTLETSLTNYVDSQIAAIPVPVAVSSITAYGSAPNAAGGTITGTALTLQPTDGTNPGGISGTSQTLSVSPNIVTFAGQVNHSNVIRLSASNSVQFNGSSTQYIRYASNITTGLQFGGDNFEFQPTATTSVLYYSQKINADRYGIIAKDDQSGTPGNFTTTRSAGRAAFTATGAATDTVIVITNNTAGKAFAATDDAYVTFIDLDATATTMKAVCTANTLTVTANAAATATCRFSWWLLK